MYHVLKTTPCERCEGTGIIINPLYRPRNKKKEEIECHACRGFGGIETKVTLESALKELSRTGELKQILRQGENND